MKKVSLTLVLVLALVGITLLCLWRWSTQKEGFQGPPSDSTPPVTGAPGSPTQERDELKRKVTEIQSNLRAIEQGKRAQEANLYKTLDPESIYTIEYMMGEVQLFSQTSSEMRMLTTALELFDTMPETTRATVRMIILTGYQESQILLYIFSTAPSLIVASDTVVDSSSATPTTMNDPAVATQTAATIRQILSTLPSPSAQLKQKQGAFEAAVETMTSVSSPSADTIASAIATFTDYQRVINIMLNVYEQAIARVQPSGMTVTQPTETNLLQAKQDSAQGNYSSTLMTALISLKGAKAKVDAIAPSNQGNKDFTAFQTSLEAAIQNYTRRETTMVKPFVGPPPMAPTVAPAPSSTEAPPSVEMPSTPAPPPFEMPSTPAPPPLEGFASGGNPYSSPSPNLSQSFEFRLGKRELVDRVTQVAR